MLFENEPFHMNRLSSADYLKSIDISLYTGEVSFAQAKQLVGAGLQHLVIGYDTSQLSSDQRDVFLQAGVQYWDVYRYITFQSPLEEQVNNVLEAIARIPSGDPKPGYLWLDIEDDSGLATTTCQQIIINSVTLAKQGPTPLGVYTGLWWWNKYVPGWTWCADNGLYLWDAFWDGTLNVDGPPLYGGWTPATQIGKQYAGNLPSIIPAVDGDVFRNRGLNPNPNPVPSPIITDPEVIARILAIETKMAGINSATK